MNSGLMEILTPGGTVVPQSCFISVGVYLASLSLQNSMPPSPTGRKRIQIKVLDIFKLLAVF